MASESLRTEAEKNILNFIYSLRLLKSLVEIADLDSFHDFLGETEHTWTFKKEKLRLPLGKIPQQPVLKILAAVRNFSVHT